MREQILAVQRMQDYIEKNRTGEISLSDLARASLVSPWYAYRLFRSRSSFLTARNTVNCERSRSPGPTFNPFSYRPSASRNACASSSAAGGRRITSPIPSYIAYVLVFVYAVNGARGFVSGFWQLLVILSVMNLIDRFLVDDWWVGHTKAWTIPGTEDLKPYITAADKRKKWAFGTVGMAVISAVLAGIMALILR